MRNLILGSEGFVGAPFTRYLRSLGEEVIGIDIKTGPSQDLRYAQLDLNGIDRVYFLAWDVGGAKYLYRKNTQLSQLDWNLQLLINTMHQISKKGIPFLFVSSQLAEQCDTVYGVTKRLGEVWTHLLGGTCLRLWNVYGPIECITDRSHVVSDIVTQAVTHGEIRLMTSGDERRQFIHIDDVCRAFHMAIDLNLNGLYDVTSFEWTRIIDIASIVASITDAKIHAGTQIGNTPNTPTQGKLPGWLPQIPLIDGLSYMIRAMRTM